MSYFEQILVQAHANVNTKNNATSGQKDVKRTDGSKIASQSNLNARIPLKSKEVEKSATKQKSGVDESRIAAYLQKKEAEKRKIEVEKQKQRENIMRLRMQSFGGKANKKIARQFRTTPIALQEKFGTDKDHEERLRRIEQREAEEADRLSCEVRQGVLKAMERKKKVDEIKTKSGGGALASKGFCAKKDILYLTRSDNDKVYGPSSSKSTPEDKQKMAKKLSTAIDFSTLMEKAAENRTKLNPNNSERSGVKVKPANENYRPNMNSSGSSGKMETGRITKFSNRASFQQSQSRVPFSNSTLSTVRIPKKANLQDKDKITGKSASIVRHEIVPARPMVEQKERRYLPGDLRYKEASQNQANTSNKTAGVKSSTSGGRPSASSSMSVVPSMKPTAPSTRPITYDMKPSASCKRATLSGTKPNASGMRPTTSALKKGLPVEKMEAKRPRHDINLNNVNDMRNRNLPSKYPNSPYERRNPPPTRLAPSAHDYDEDDEYDSEMDDFIDDTEVDDDLQRRELEETLRLINPRYNKARWKMNERMIDDRSMEANFRDVAREERISARIGLMEDIREAQLGKSVAL